jgi:hypothetical protein
LDARCIARNVDAVLNRFDYLRDAPRKPPAVALVTVAAILAAIALAMQSSHHAARVPPGVGRAAPVAVRLVHSPHRVPSRATVPKPNRNARRTRRPAVIVPRRIVPAAPVVDAIALGESPKALVEIDGRTTAVGLGSSLRSNVVTEIDSGGLLLADGERLRLNSRIKRARHAPSF